MLKVRKTASSFVYTLKKRIRTIGVDRRRNELRVFLESDPLILKHILSFGSSWRIRLVRRR
jgi:hypothetical protein